MEKATAHDYALKFIKQEGVHYGFKSEGGIEAWAGNYYSSRASGSDEAEAYDALVATLSILFVYCDSEAELLPPTDANFQVGDFQKNLKAFFDKVAAEFERERLLVEKSDPDLTTLEGRLQRLTRSAEEFSEAVNSGQAVMPASWKARPTEE